MPVARYHRDARAELERLWHAIARHNDMYRKSNPSMCNYTPSEPACLARSMHGVSARSVLILGDDWWLHLAYDRKAGRTSQVMTRLAIEAVLGDKCQS
jgi:hypothetical protein